MAVESRDTRLLPEVARAWVDALGERFGPGVESRLIAAARPLVDQYLKEWNVAPKSDDDRKRYLARVVWVRLPLVAIRGTGACRRPARSSHGDQTAE